MGKASRHKRERHAHLAFGSPSDDRTIDNPEGIAISPSLVELVQPYLDEAESLNEVKVIVSAGALAWNSVIMPEAERKRTLENIAASLDDETAPAYLSLVQELADRKQDMFPDDPRVITGWDVRKKAGRPYVTVSAVVNLPEEPEAGG